MGRQYAAILGLIAFATTIAQGLLEGGSAAATLRGACGAQLLFAAVGALLGWLADGVVRQTVERPWE